MISGVGAHIGGGGGGIRRGAEQSVKVSPPLTITSTPVSLCTVSLTGLAVGSLLLVTGWGQFTKGATSGDVSFDVRKAAGSASVVLGVTRPAPIVWFESFAASATAQFTLIGVMQVTAAGSIDLALRGSSSGSDSASGGAELHVVELR